MSEVVVNRYSTGADLVAGAAEAFIDLVVSAQRERGFASVVLTGGGNGIGLLKSLRENSGDIDWSAIDIYFGDDRFLPAHDPERNELQAREALLNHVPIDPERVFAVAPSDGEFGDDIEAAATAYADVLASQAADGQVPSFDLHLLGMGPEGHINSLFPDTDAVRETQKFVVAVTDSPKPPPTRVTLTLPAVNRARQVWSLVAGENKAEAVKASIDGVPAVAIPAAGAHGIDKTVWFIDDGAASLL